MDIFGRYSGGGVCVGCKVRDRIFNILEEFCDIHDSIKNVISSLRICKYHPRMIKLCDQTSEAKVIVYDSFFLSFIGITSHSQNLLV